MSRHLSPLRLWVGCLAFVAATTVLGVACAEKGDGVTPRDCADRDNAEVCE